MPAVSDLTEPMLNPTTETCPRGHTVAAESVTIRDGRKICPVCEQEASTWANPPGRVVLWSRQLLRIPLIVVAAAVVGLAIASAFGIAANASLLSSHLPGATAALIGSIFETVAELALAGAAAWAAYLVGLEDRQPG